MGEPAVPAQVVDGMLGGCAQVGIDQEDLAPACAEAVARLLAVVLLPSPEWGLVARSTWALRLRRRDSRLVRADR